MSIKNALIALVVALGLCGTVGADTLELKPNHPDRYVVVKGDTLWDISSKFLQDPWRWPEIWYVNPEIENPHLIYPGDVITLVWRGGKPYLEVQRGRQTVKLSPQARSTKLTGAIETIPSEAISQFLQRPEVMTEDQMKNAAYVVGSEEGRLISGVDNKIYVRNLNSRGDEKAYTVIRVGDPYYDPKTEELLGYEALHVADAHLIRETDPATMLITNSFRETLIGDKVVPLTQQETQQNFIPHAPDKDVSGSIISILDGVSRAGQYQSVVINLGQREGMEKGHVLAVRLAGTRVLDLNAKNSRDRWVTLPEERAALIMVYRAFDKVSYALIMSAEKDIKVGDSVVNP